MYRTPSQLTNDFCQSLRFLQKHFESPCKDSLASLEEKKLTNFRTRSFSLVILQTLALLVKEKDGLVWNKKKYPEVTPRLACQVLDLAVEKNTADKSKSKKNIAEKVREAKIFSRPIPGSLLTTKRSLALIATRNMS